MKIILLLVALSANAWGAADDQGPLLPSAPKETVMLCVHPDEGTASVTITTNDANGHRCTVAVTVPAAREILKKSPANMAAIFAKAAAALERAPRGLAYAADQTARPRAEVVEPPASLPSLLPDDFLRGAR